VRNLGDAGRAEREAPVVGLLNGYLPYFPLLRNRLTPQIAGSEIGRIGFFEQ
jgi:hypothetical protein